MLSIQRIKRLKEELSTNKQAILWKINCKIRYLLSLLYPDYEGLNEEKNAISLHYSVSITMTDVDIGAVLSVGLDGSITVK